MIQRGALRRAFSAPSDDIGAINLRANKDDLDLGGEPPAARPTSSRAPPEAAVEGRHEICLRASMLSSGSSLLDEFPVDDLVMALVLGDGEEILQRGGLIR